MYRSRPACNPCCNVFTASGIFKSTCRIDVRWFPFDVQRCELKFGSWTYGGWSLDLNMSEADISGFTANGEWDLVGKRDWWPVNWSSASQRQIVLDNNTNYGLDFTAEALVQSNHCIYQSNTSVWSASLIITLYVNGMIISKHLTPCLLDLFVFCFMSQRFQDRGMSTCMNAVRSRTLMSPSLWWCGGGPSTMVSICSSPASWSPPWPCLSFCCLPTLGRRSHWVRYVEHTNTCTHIQTHTHLWSPVFQIHCKS